MECEKSRTFNAEPAIRINTELNGERITPESVHTGRGTHNVTQIHITI